MIRFKKIFISSTVLSNFLKTGRYYLPGSCETYRTSSERVTYVLSASYVQAGGQDITISLKCVAVITINYVQKAHRFLVTSLLSLKRMCQLESLLFIYLFVFVFFHFYFFRFWYFHFWFKNWAKPRGVMRIQSNVK